MRSGKILRNLAPVLALAALPGCGSSKNPSGPSTTVTQPVQAVLTGSTRDGTTDAPIPAVTVRIDGVGQVVSDATGRFEIMAPLPQQMRTAVISSSQTVTRETHLNAPGPNASVNLIPASFDLGAFNELFRYGDQGLHRWTTAPRLTIVNRVLKFTDVSSMEYVATATTLSDADIDAILQDLGWALPQLTAGAYSGFASTTRVTPAEGERVLVRRAGEIIVARYEGLSGATSYAGYGRWWSDSSGAVFSGAIMLDLGFDSSSSGYIRSLRVHEMGHALGYGHVSLRDSFMNPAATAVPNEFDLRAVRLAFQRPPLNKPPDTDPSPFTVNIHTGEVREYGLP